MGVTVDYAEPGEDEIAALLELEGTLGECDEAELRARIEAARAIWRVS